MANRKHKPYDDDTLVVAIASGNKTHAQIAEEFGLSQSMVHFIVTGRHRPELQRLIAAASASQRDRAQRLAGHVAAGAMARLAKLIDNDSEASPEVQRKAAVDILRYAIGRPAGRPAASAASSMQQFDLQGEIDAIIQALGPNASVRRPRPRPERRPAEPHPAADAAEYGSSR